MIPRTNTLVKACVGGCLVLVIFWVLSRLEKSSLQYLEAEKERRFLNLKRITRGHASSYRERAQSIISTTTLVTVPRTTTSWTTKPPTTKPPTTKPPTTKPPTTKPPTTKPPTIKTPTTKPPTIKTPTTKPTAKLTTKPRPAAQQTNVRQLPKVTTDKSPTVKPAPPTEPPSPPPIVDPVTDKEILYFVKACKRFQQRSLQLYQAWGNKVANVIFSTDALLDGVPKQLQRIDPFNQPGDEAFKREAREWFHAASCGLTFINLGKILKEKAYNNIKWIAFVDDDTFVIRDNIPKYFSTLSSSKPQFLALSNAEPLYWYPRASATSPFMAVGATAAGLVYSKGLMDDIRGDHQKIFGRPDIYKHCRRAKYGDDVAIGLLARVDYNLSVLARPDLRGYHWHKMKSPVEIKPLTIHTEQQFAPGHISDLSALTAKYYPGEKGH